MKKVKDFGKWAESITAKVRSMCADQAKQLDLPMIYLPSASIEKEAYARPIMAERNLMKNVQKKQENDG